MTSWLLLVVVIIVPSQAAACDNILEDKACKDTLKSNTHFLPCTNFLSLLHVIAKTTFLQDLQKLTFIFFSIFWRKMEQY